MNFKCTKFATDHAEIKRNSFLFVIGKDPYEFMSHPGANIFDLRDFLKAGERLEMPEKCPDGV